MKIFSYLAASLLACAAFLFTSCDEGVEHTRDQTGAIYGIWMLDTGITDIQYKSGENSEQKHDETDFNGDNFLLCLYEPRTAFASEGTIFTFDIDDVDAKFFSYNENSKKISFDGTLYLTKGFLTPKIMSLSGTWDVKELTDQKLILSKSESVVIGSFNGNQTTIYSYHKVASTKKLQ